MKQKSISAFVTMFFCSLMVIGCATQKADKVVVDKAHSKLYVMKGKKPLKAYRIALGPNPTGHKQHQGDGRTPEGDYLLDFKNINSKFYKSIRVSYPNAYDLARAQALGVDPGGDIMIHGQMNNSKVFSSIMQKSNWTQGCIAVTNKEMDEIWRMVDIGTPIEIRS